MKYPLTIFLLSLTTFLMSQEAVRIEIQSLPAYHASGSRVYAAGSFNGWNPQNEQYRFKQDKKGNYFLDLHLAPGHYDYKVTRGSWDNVECKKGGESIDNRSLTVPSDSIYRISITEWHDRFPARPKVSTASKNVHIMDTAFLIPQLKRVRRVWIYLPENYERDASVHYPVLYLQDGQNVFDEATSFSGEWGVDEFMDSTSLSGSIVVAIDHGGEKRMNEYNPYDHSKFGKGEGAIYADFIANTLKPYIDLHYRTLKDKTNTFIAGSSMGGLISFYTVLKYPQIFGGAGIFSPSFWITEKNIDKDIAQLAPKMDARLYFYCGKLEGKEMLDGMNDVITNLKKISPATIKSSVNETGKHNEPTWRKEFGKFYSWLMGKK